MGSITQRRRGLSSIRPRRRKHDTAARAGGGTAGNDANANNNNNTNNPPPRPLISGPAVPLQMPRWPLPPLGDDEAAITTIAATTASTTTAAELARSRLRVAFESAIADACNLGVPRSALPAPQEGASAEELAAALAHVEDVVSSFLSANI